MKLLSQARPNRKAAFFMLALWVFALASGVANACLLEDRAHSGHVDSVKVAHERGSPEHLELAAHHSEETSKAPCLKACDDGARALQYNGWADPGDPGSAPLVAILWDPTHVASAPHRVADPQPRIADPPQRIRYSRWEL